MSSHKRWMEITLALAVLTVGGVAGGIYWWSVLFAGSTVVVKNQSGHAADGVVVEVRGSGTRTYPIGRIEDGHAATVRVKMAGEGSVRVTYRGADGRVQSSDQEYIEHSGYRVTFVLTKQGRVQGNTKIVP